MNHSKATITRFQQILALHNIRIEFTIGDSLSMLEFIKRTTMYDLTKRSQKPKSYKKDKSKKAIIESLKRENKVNPTGGWNPGPQD